MQPLSSPHVIIEASHGSYRVITASVENAKAIYERHKDRLPTEVCDIVAAFKNKGLYVVLAETLSRALGDVMEKPVGEPSSALRRLLYGAPPARDSGQPDTRPEALVSAELRAELAVWALESDRDARSLKRLSAYDFQNLDVFKLSLCKGVLERAAGRKVLLVDGEMYDMAEEVRIIEADRWKATAREEDVLCRILAFVSKNLCSRDENFELAMLSTTY